MTWADDIGLSRYDGGVANASVLVVDDNAENRALAQATLDDEGYRVILATSGAEAIAAFEAEQPDCILLDVRMPGLDGPATCERIRALPGGHDVPVIFVTALRDVETFDRTVRSGGDDFLTKPFRPAELVVRVAAALKLRRLAAERGELYAVIKQQREDLQRLQLQKEQLVAFLVHDLKNPVSAILLQAELILRAKDHRERARTAAAAIVDDSRVLLGMITTLLDIAKADEGRLVVAPRPIELAALCRVLTDELELRARNANVQLTHALEVPTLIADPELLRRILENLIDNALRHAPEGSAVRISSRAVTGGVELRVRDEGPGVPAGQREQVFERFTQASGSPATRTNRGLGLAFCKLAVEAHGGRIWIEDEQPGASFCVWLANP